MSIRLESQRNLIFNAYGTRVRTTGAYGAVFGVFFQKLANKPFTVVGDGEQTRDFIYVTDVANAFLPLRLLIPKVSVTTLAIRTHKASIGLLA